MHDATRAQIIWLRTLRMNMTHAFMQELLPVHGGAVRGEEAGGAVAAGPLHGDHHVRGAAHAPEPRRPPQGRRRRRFHALRSCRRLPPPRPAHDRRLRWHAERLSAASSCRGHRRWWWWPAAPLDAASPPRAAASPSSFLAAGSRGRVWRRAGLHSFHSAMSNGQRAYIRRRPLLQAS